MAEKFYSLLTNIGKAKIANSVGLGTKINFVTMKVGDGGGAYYEPTEDQLDLKNTVWSGNINHVEIDESNPNWINIEVMIPSNVGGFTIREYGAFDESGNMLAICKCAESYKPVIADGSTKELLLNMVLAVSNTDNITLKIDPTIIFAKKSEVEQLRTDVNAAITGINSSLSEIVQEQTTQNDNINLKANNTDNTRKTNSKTVTGAINELSDGKIDKSDFVSKNSYAVTTGTSTAYTVTTNPVPTAYTDGMTITIIPHVDCGATPTLNWNGLGALTIVNQDGSAINTGDIKANKPLSLVRVGSNFFIRSASCKSILNRFFPSFFIGSSDENTKWIFLNDPGYYAYSLVYDTLTKCFYYVGNAWSGTIARVDQYNPIMGTLTSKAATPTNVLYGSSTIAMKNGTIYNLNSHHYSTNALYNATLNTWTTKTPHYPGNLTSERQWTDGYSALVNDKIFFFKCDYYDTYNTMTSGGGYKNFYYNTVTDTWTGLTDNANISIICGVFVKGTKIYLLLNTGNFDIYDTTTNQYINLVTNNNPVTKATMPITTPMHIFFIKSNTVRVHCNNKITEYNIDSNTWNDSVSAPYTINLFNISMGANDTVGYRNTQIDYDDKGNVFGMWSCMVRRYSGATYQGSDNYQKLAFRLNI